MGMAYASFGATRLTPHPTPKRIAAIDSGLRRARTVVAHCDVPLGTEQEYRSGYLQMHSDRFEGHGGDCKTCCFPILSVQAV